MPRGRGTENHVHKYFRIDGGLWGCGECTHYLPKNVARMIYSRFSRCWECDRLVKMEDKIMDFAIQNNNSQILCEKCIERLKRIQSGEDVVLKEAAELAEKIARGEL